MNTAQFAARNHNCAILTDKPEIGNRRFFHKPIKHNFVEKILSGEKVTTHRTPPKGDKPRIPNAGDFLRFYVWSGKPYKSAQVWVCDVEIYWYGADLNHDSRWGNFEYQVLTDGILFSLNRMNKVAEMDGFVNYAEMLAWFEREYKLKGDWKLPVCVWRWAKIVAVNEKFLISENDGNVN